MDKKSNLLAYSRAQYWKHREKRLAAKKVYGIKNRDKILVARKEYYQKNKEAIYAKTQAKRNSRIEEINQETGGLCAICLLPERQKNSVGGIRLLNRDHDHATGLKRSYLCMDCNTALGKFKDDPAMLRKAAEYIEKWKILHSQ